MTGHAGVDGQPTEVGGYRLTALLGQGGFGAVYLGENAGGRRAAVKLLHGAITDDVRDSLAREVAAARKVKQFCIAQVLDADPYAPRPWIATEYLEGPTLADRVRDRGPLEGAALERVAVATATALTAIHTSGILHRDFKPANIILAPDGARVIDFGIAKAAEQAQVMASGVVGTPAYMAPEQIRGGLLDDRLDVFAWGAVMVYAATGRDAFAGPNQQAVIHRVLSEEPDLAGLPPALLPLVRRCLDKDPRRRPSAHQVLSLLIGHEEHAADTDAALSGGRTAVLGGDTLSYTQKTPRPEGHESRQGGAQHTPPAATPPRATPGHQAPPFEFAGTLFHSPGDLAAGMQRRWAAGAAVFADDAERAELLNWLVDDLGDTTVNRGLLRRRPEDPDLVLARFVADLRPDLPPVYRGDDMRPGALRAALEARTGAERTALLMRVFGEQRMRAKSFAHIVEVMRVMAAHSGAQAEYRGLLSDYAASVDAVLAASQRINEAFTASGAAQTVFRSGAAQPVPTRAGSASGLVDLGRAEVALRIVDQLLTGVRDVVRESPFSPDSGEQRWLEALAAALGAATGPGAAGAAAVLEECLPLAGLLAEVEGTLLYRHTEYVEAAEKASGRWRRRRVFDVVVLTVGWTLISAVLLFCALVLTAVDYTAAMEVMVAMFLFFACGTTALAIFGVTSWTRTKISARRHRHHADQLRSTAGEIRNDTARLAGARQRLESPRTGDTPHGTRAF
ncbi:serine/threonine protein kinase [Thermobifida halotolerans]|uniref:non-specific serine/threonine protein kinase n=1 Tax=Thermobifida halotolerans TaxID=483545 RepID=A0AA97M169_9ACTN|nr:serine/threonine-protein kinase [Thermobifida halotolerans]UOE21699.1 serine/threonine protein kinase [Thermobifida halotolerans]